MFELICYFCVLSARRDGGGENANGAPQAPLRYPGEERRRPEPAGIVSALAFFVSGSFYSDRWTLDTISAPKGVLSDALDLDHELIWRLRPVKPNSTFC